ncbi:MAG: hemolysin, partial [Acidobacteriota bacterium]
MSDAGVLNTQSSGLAYTNADVILLLTYVLLALIFSFLCSIAEAVLLSTTPSYIAGLLAKKSRIAPLLKKIRQENIEQSLAAILTLNTIAHTVGAIGSGAKATVVFGSAWFGLF